MSDAPPPESPTPKKTGWRGSKAPAARPSPKYGWMSDAQKPLKDANARNRKRRMRAAMLVITSLAITAGTIWYISKIPVSTPLLVLSITDYADPVPPNAWAKEDYESLAAAWPSTADDGFRLWPLRLPKTSRNVAISEKSQVWTPTDTASALADLARRLESLQPGGPELDRNSKSGAVVIYLSGHGVVDEKGRPCLLMPHDPSLATALGSAVKLPYLADDRRLPLEEILVIVKKRFPDSVHKLLILDCQRIDLHFGLGIFYNDFARKFEDLIRNQAIPNLAALMSADPEQVGWSSPQLKHSVFGHYVRLGLLGDADSSGDGIISLKELGGFVGDRTHRWVSRHCSDSQRPRLIGLDAGTDFQLAYVSTDRPADPVISSPAPIATSPQSAGADQTTAADSNRSSWEDVDKLWSTLDDLYPWRDDDSTGYRTARRFTEWESLRTGLIRLEQLKTSGAAYREQADNLQRTLTLTAERLKNPAVDEATRPVWHGLRAARYWGDLGEFGSLPDLQAKVDEKKNPNESTTPFVTRVAQAWKWAQTDRFDAQFLETNVRPYLSHPSAGLQSPEPLEHRFLSMLERLPPEVKETKSREDLLEIIRSREAAEEAAVGAGDERVHYFTQILIDQADDQRRRNEDRIFLGTFSNEERDGVTAVTASYRRAIERSKALAKVLLIRNRAWADLPHYVRWLSRRPHLQSFSSDLESDLVPKLRTLIRSNADISVQFESMLHDELNTRGWSNGTEFAGRMEALQKTAATVAELHDELARKFQDAVDRWAFADADNVVSWREAADLLSIPLVKFDARKRLRDRVLSQPLYTIDIRETTPEPAPLDRPWVARWGADRHPILELLDRRFLESSSTTELSSTAKSTIIKSADPAQASDDAKRHIAIEFLTKQGHDAVTQMRELISDVRKWMDEPTAGNGPSWFDQRDPRSRAEKLFRVGTGLLPSSLLGSEGAANDPIRRLNEYDLHHLVNWLGMRACNDFWGSGNASTRQFFDVAAEDYLLTAKRLKPGESRIAGELRTLLERRRRAVPSILTPTIDPALPPQSGPAYEVGFDVAKSVDAPEGSAAFYVVERVGAADRTTGPRLGIDMRPSTSVQKSVIRFTTTVDTSSSSPTTSATVAPSRRLVGFWRGHLQERPVNIHQSTPAGEFVFRPSLQREASVVVKGADVEPGTVALVLDCSGSMDRPGGGGVTRMRFAKQAVTQIAESLAASGKYNVSLWFYGHRVGFEEIAPNVFARSPSKTWKGPIPADLLPSDDVEKVWSGVLHGRNLKEFKDLIDSAQPRGSTPLYLSMLDALKTDLVNAKGTAPRYLIVITDGLNDVNNVSLGPPKRTVSPSQVKEVLADDARRGGKQIKVDVIGCGSPGDQLQFVRDLYQPGLEIKAHTAQSQGDLLKALSEALHLYDYDVVSVHGGNQVGPSTPMNRTTTVGELHQGQPIRFRAQLKGYPQISAEFALEGGESIELALDVRPAGLRLIHERYFGTSGWIQDIVEQVRVPDEVIAAAGTGSPIPQTYYVAAARPDVEADGDGRLIRFPITIQNGDAEKFSPRPAEVWVEITPLIGDQPAPNVRRYAVYDVGYRAGRPVPVLECVVRGWPPAARAAEIKLWWKPTPSKKLTSKLSAASTEPLKLALEDGSTATFSADISSVPDGVEVNIQEQRSRSYAPDDALPVRVEVDGVGQDPDLIRRSYTLDGRATVHTFLFRNATEAKVLNYELKVGSAAEAKAGAVTLPPEKPTFKVRLPSE